jgi:hypothetical protein
VVAPAEIERQLDRLVLALGVGEKLGNRRAQPQIVRMAGPEVLEPPADRLAFLEAQDGARHLVHVPHLAVVVDHHEPVLDAFDDA